MSTETITVAGSGFSFPPRETVTVTVPGLASTHIQTVTVTRSGRKKPHHGHRPLPVAIDIDSSTTIQETLTLTTTLHVSGIPPQGSEAVQVDEASTTATQFSITNSYIPPAENPLIASTFSHHHHPQDGWHPDWAQDPKIVTITVNYAVSPPPTSTQSTPPSSPTSTPFNPSLSLPGWLDDPERIPCSYSISSIITSTITPAPLENEAEDEDDLCNPEDLSTIITTVCNTITQTIYPDDEFPSATTSFSQPSAVPSIDIDEINESKSSMIPSFPWWPGK